eukprot:2243172-Amphidinium_carterae.1
MHASTSILRNPQERQFFNPTCTLWLLGLLLLSQPRKPGHHHPGPTICQSDACQSTLSQMSTPIVVCLAPDREVFRRRGLATLKAEDTIQSDRYNQTCRTEIQPTAYAVVQLSILRQMLPVAKTLLQNRSEQAISMPLSPAQLQARELVLGKPTALQHLNEEFQRDPVIVLAAVSVD